MTEKRRVYRRPSEGRGAALSASGGLSGDPMRDASRRLGWVGLVGAGGFLSALVLNHIFKIPIYLQHDMYDVTGFLLGSAVFLTSRRAKLRPHQIFQVGTLFEIVGGLMIVVPEHEVLVQATSGGFVGISWLTAWIAFFAMVLPARPLTTVAAALVTASMNPLALWIGTLARHPWPPPSVTARLLIPNYLVAGFMAIPAIGIYRLNRAVAEARELGSYHLEEQLGQGGMGEVWRAWHRMLARPAAIKLISPEVLEKAIGIERSELQQRFEREARATASLTSPHTVALHDFGVTEDGTFYYVMELLHGLDLEKLVERFGPMPTERTVHYLLQICELLDEAHARKLLHRDITPANVYASRLGRRVDFIKLLDFGLVKRWHDVSVGINPLTVDQDVRGTPAFMASERWTKGAIDGGTDLYSVGCVGFWMLTGCMVFEGRTPWELASHHMATPPVPPSHRTEWPVPRELDAIILACLEKEPANRPPSASALAERLATVPLRHPWKEERAEAWWRMHLPETLADGGERAPRQVS